MDNRLSRRDFIKAAGITAASVAFGSLVPSGYAKADTKKPDANSRINVGVIGLGQMGLAHAKNLIAMSADKNVALVAVCDIYEKRRSCILKSSSLTEKLVYADYRKLLENKDIDAVVIATPEHLHSQMVLDTLDAGKHVYCEKPFVRKMEDAFRIREKTKQGKRVVQVGSHSCSDPRWKKTAEKVRAGKLGTVLWGQASFCRVDYMNYDIEPEANEKTIDWKMWLGDLPERPWNPEHFFRWRKYWDYSSGIISDLAPHRLPPLMIGMDCLEFPSRVSCIGGNLANLDDGVAPKRDVPDTVMLTVEFPSGKIIYMPISCANEQGLKDMVRGSKATVFLGGNKIELLPERKYSEELDFESENFTDLTEEHIRHMTDFLSSIRTGSEPSCPVDLALRVQVIVSMAEISYREHRSVEFDPAKQKVI